MKKDARLYIAGHNGMVGSAIHRLLLSEGYTNILTAGSKELDLRNQSAVNVFFEKAQPEYVFLAAAKVGGIVANNSLRADFLYDNLMIECNVIHAAHSYGVEKLLFLGSSCIYPKMAEQPIKESSLLTGPLEPTNEPYALAKIAGLKLCESYRKQYDDDFITLMPTNLYGPNDNYHPEHSHVLPALLRRFHEAKQEGTPEVVLWGSGTPLREFLHVDDLADACLFAMEHYSSAEHLNVGSGKEISIYELAKIIQEIVGYEGQINLDGSKPDGTPRKLMDSSRIKVLGWKAKTDLKEGIREVYQSINWQKIRGY